MTNSDFLIDIKYELVDILDHLDHFRHEINFLLLIIMSILLIFCVVMMIMQYNNNKMVESISDKLLAIFHVINPDEKEEEISTEDKIANASDELDEIRDEISKLQKLADMQEERIKALKEELK